MAQGRDQASATAEPVSEVLDHETQLGADVRPHEGLPLPGAHHGLCRSLWLGHEDQHRLVQGRPLALRVVDPQGDHLVLRGAHRPHALPQVAHEQRLRGEGQGGRERGQAPVAGGGAAGGRRERLHGALPVLPHCHHHPLRCGRPPAQRGRRGRRICLQAHSQPGGGDVPHLRGLLLLRPGRASPEALLRQGAQRQEAHDSDEGGQPRGEGGCRRGGGGGGQGGKGGARCLHLASRQDLVLRDGRGVARLPPHADGADAEAPHRHRGEHAELQLCLVLHVCHAVAAGALLRWEGVGPGHRARHRDHHPELHPRLCP
mmetsp:Transcript_83813/g.203291  ORF Transcript_83813/g.203291 Transcript_83813/m.203291 type:complete len:316 (-) Transcript_83813:723-1670(-)